MAGSLHRTLNTALAALAASLAMHTQDASAAYLSLSIPAEEPRYVSWQFRAADGESNAVLLFETARGLAVRDVLPVRVLARDGATSRCGTALALELTCTSARGERVRLLADLADGDDRGTISGRYYPVLDGGSGADSLTAAGPARLVGGPGHDVLTGSGGADEFEGGPGRDRIDGRGGADTVSYSPTGPYSPDRLPPFVVDLRRSGPQSRSTGGDVLTGIENVELIFHRGRLTGSGGANVLIGSQAADVLDGGGGNDTLIASTGGDRLTGGPGRDRLFGDNGDRVHGPGGGNDYVSSADGERDFVDCGPGRDRADVDRFDRVTGCEQVTRSGR